MDIESKYVPSLLSKNGWQPYLGRRTGQQETKQGIPAPVRDGRGTTRLNEQTREEIRAFVPQEDDNEKR